MKGEPGGFKNKHIRARPRHESAPPIAITDRLWDILRDHEPSPTNRSRPVLLIAGLLLSLGSFPRTDLPARCRIDWLLSYGLRLAVDRS
jgi:hypothetical protein